MFTLYCDNKGCGKSQTPLLDTTSNEVICQECHRPINSITDFAKRQMKGFGQTLKSKKPTTGFVVKCTSCNVQNTPTQKGDDFQCPNCLSILNLSGPFKQMLKEKLKANS